MIEPVDEQTMMRFVDGEVTQSERMAILERIALQTDGWRTCALAFVENQVWQETLDAQDDRSTACTPTARTAPEGPRTWPASSDAARQSATHMESGTPGNRHPRDRWAIRVGLAAAIACSFFAGTWATRHSVFHDQSVSATSGHLGKVVGKPDVSSPAGGQSSSRDRLEQPAHAFDPGIAGTLADHAPTPVLLDREFWKHSSSVPAELRNEMRSLGMEVTGERGLIPLRSTDGSDWIVPYEDVRIVPVRNTSL